MKIITSAKEAQEYVIKAKKEGKKVGLVPTMGYFHEGHLSLMRKAREDCDLVVTSIFVNPTQFGPNEDYDRYPRDLNRDMALAETVSVDVIFAPPVEEMYPPGYHTYVTVESLTATLCGASRPTHFRGVTTVVTKLFNIIQPDLAYFGQKDAQQVTVIERMVADLNMPVQIVRVPIVREKDGLAMSSRNVYLSPEERKEALVLSRSLAAAESLVKAGERNGEKIKNHILSIIKGAPLAQIDYVEIVNNQTLEPVEVLTGQVLIALAVRFGNTRLIDNLLLEV